MQLQITDSNDVLTKHFGEWLIERIQEKFSASIDDNKLKRWDKFFEDAPQYKSIYKKKILTKDILVTGIRNLVCQQSSSFLSIRIDNNKFVPGLDRVKVDSICKLINYGNQDIKGYPIFTDTFEHFAASIHDYVDEYLNLM